MDTDKIQPGQKGIGAIAEQFVAGVGRRAGAADEDFYSGFIARLEYCFRHDTVDFAVPQTVRAPTGN